MLTNTQLLAQYLAAEDAYLVARVAAAADGAADDAVIAARAAKAATRAAYDAYRAADNAA